MLMEYFAGTTFSLPASPKAAGISYFCIVSVEIRFSGYPWQPGRHQKNKRATGDNRKNCSD